MSENNKINVLIHGAGSTINGLIRKFRQSELLNEIYIISSAEPGFDCVYLGNSSKLRISDLKSLIKEKDINLVVIFSETYSISGLVDFYQETMNIPVFGVIKEWAVLEHSKIKCKDFMINNEIKTPDYELVYNLYELKCAIKHLGLPIVIKNNGLKAGFGSYICSSEKECINITKKILNESKAFCIAEKFIYGEELTVHYIWDGNKLIQLNPVKDYKKALNENKGINTGGMGSYTPVKLSDKRTKLLQHYHRRLDEIFTAKKPKFTGIFAVNLLFENDNIYTLEFNMRPGITEFEVLIENMDCDILNLINSAANGNTDEKSIKYKDTNTAGVVVAYKDYINNNKSEHLKTIDISKIQKYENQNFKINLNTLKPDKKGRCKFSTNKRILTVINTDSFNPSKAIYKMLEESIHNKNLYYRKDIGEVYEK